MTWEEYKWCIYLLWEQWKMNKMIAGQHKRPSWAEIRTWIYCNNNSKSQLFCFSRCSFLWTGHYRWAITVSHLRLWDFTESPSSQRSLRVLPSSLVRTPDTSEWGCTYYLYFIAKTPKSSVCFQEATIFPRGLHFWDQHFSFYQYFEIEFFLYQWLLGYYKANTFLETFSEN